MSSYGHVERSAISFHLNPGHEEVAGLAKAKGSYLEHRHYNGNYLLKKLRTRTPLASCIIMHRAMYRERPLLHAMRSSRRRPSWA